MITKADVSKIELVSCDICLNEVPKCSGKIMEIEDYVMYFCGLECFDKWHKQADQNTQQSRK